jgi:hypothetical protein
LRYEHDLIEQAMAASGRRLIREAKRLETSHQALRAIINGRHKNTLGVKYTKRKRKPTGSKRQVGLQKQE